MVKIKEIRVRNFRSIIDMTLSPKDLNVIVGLNDSGKSNILKALNLFFNNQTDENKSFDFRTDYSKLAPKRINKAQEITIQIKFEIPSNYKDAGEFTWKKIWRESGIYFDNVNGPAPVQSLKVYEFAPYSKTPILLNRIEYIYVPATKSNEYFMRLLSVLYASISEDAESQINKKTDEYSIAVQHFTKRISEIIKESIGIESALTMPPKQIDIFQLFTFNTKDILGNEVFLEQRGDGIKARHIPAILKFISEYKNRTLGKSSIPYTTIWGYEEPETGIELSRCFDLSKQLFKYSTEIQIFLTTHSPAFYSIEEQERTAIKYIVKNDNAESIIKNELKQSDIHEKIGLMPLVAPFIRDKELELQNLKKILRDNYLVDVPTLIVEGITDRDTINHIISLKSNQLKTAIEDGKLRLFTMEGNGGTTQMVNWVKAWKYSGFKSKLYLLFDKDAAGRMAKIEIDSIPSAERPQNIKSQFIKPSQIIIDEIISKIRCGGDFSFELEHLYSLEFWKTMKIHHLVERRNETEIKNSLINEISLLNESFQTVMEQRITSQEVRETFFLYVPKDNKKSEIFKKACEIYKADPTSTIFDGFLPTIREIEKFFS